MHLNLSVLTRFKYQGAGFEINTDSVIHIGGPGVTGGAFHTLLFHITDRERRSPGPFKRVFPEMGAEHV